MAFVVSTALAGKMIGIALPARLAGEAWGYSVRLGLLMHCKVAVIALARQRKTPSHRPAADSRPCFAFRGNCRLGLSSAGRAANRHRRGATRRSRWCR
jgi:hypothetical protein